MDPMRLGIAGSADWTTITPLTKGWSSDRKYKITTLQRGSFLLRLFDLNQLPRKLDEYRVLSRLHEAGLPVNRPLDLGPCNDETTGYLLCAWIEGEDLEKVLTHLTVHEQYQLGRQAGKLLFKLHECSPLYPVQHWEHNYNEKLDRKIARALVCTDEIPGLLTFINVINTNRFRLSQRPITLHHGDYHVGNLLMQPSGQLAIIDLNRFDAGDPWEEFNRIVWDVQCSIAFARGRLLGYFNDHVPDEFFELFYLYLAANAISSVPWAISFGPSEVLIMQEQLRNILIWTNDFKTKKPTWLESVD